MNAAFSIPVAAVLLALTAACGASARYFRPAESVLAETPDGNLAAVYELRVGSNRWGDVRVWSNGADVREIDSVERTVLHAGFEVRNAGDAALELDLAHTRLEAINAGARATDAIAPSHVAGEPRAEPHTVSLVELEFELPEGVEPHDLDSFRLHWWVHGPEEQVYQQYTDFVPLRAYYRTWYGPPYWYDPWYFGFGYGWYWCP